MPTENGINPTHRERNDQQLRLHALTTAASSRQMVGLPSRASLLDFADVVLADAAKYEAFLRNGTTS